MSVESVRFVRFRHPVQSDPSTRGADETPHDSLPLNGTKEEARRGLRRRVRQLDMTDAIASKTGVRCINQLDGLHDRLTLRAIPLRIAHVTPFCYRSLYGSSDG